MDDIEGISSSAGTNFTNDIAETSQKNAKSSKEIMRTSSLETEKVDKPRCNLHAERIEDRSFVDKDKQNQLNFLNNPWWLKLPCVLVRNSQNIISAAV